MSVICLFCVDPGSTTGLCMGRVWEQGPVHERIASRTFFRTAVVDGSPLAQARKIFQYRESWRKVSAKAGLPVELVIEDFLLTRIESYEREGLDPVRITSAFEGYRWGLADSHELAGFGRVDVPPPVFQTPSQAMGYAKEGRLKNWGLWEPGMSEHERDAIRHFVKRISDRARAHACSPQNH